MAVREKVCALVSGGKDSLFNIKVAKELGHEIVCLANLHPVEADNIQELDSFVYQTVGHNLLPLLASAMELPLIRRAITGTPVLTEKNEYTETAQDETEDLFFLLKDVKNKFPEVSAVSVGAIFSDYQRLRVEHVAGRLGLKVLAFMWRQEQSEILSRMISAQLDAVLVKVASFGLNASHVGKSISSLAPHFHKLHANFGFHVAGEGGEYESFVLKFPGVVKFPITLTDTEVVPHGPDVWYLRAFGEISDQQSDSDEPVSAYPDLLDLSYYEKNFKRGSEIVWPFTGSEDEFDPNFRILCFETGTWDFSAVASRVPEIEKVVFVDLQIADMEKFSTINAQYGNFFAHLPPSRCTVQSALPEGVKIRARFVISDHLQFARLHVQSISTWGMACIGPYAQAVTHGNSICLTSGVLGLIPHSMTLAVDWKSEIFFAMKSLFHVVTVATKGEISAHHVPLAVVQISEGAPSIDEVEREVRKYLPNFRLLIVRVPRLPRDANIEVNLIFGLNLQVQSETGNNGCDFQVFYDVHKLQGQDVPVSEVSLTACLEISDCISGVARLVLTK